MNPEVFVNPAESVIAPRYRPIAAGVSMNHHGAPA